MLNSVIGMEDIDLDFAKQYLRVDWEEDDTEIEFYIEAAKMYLVEHTGKTLEEIKFCPFTAICCLKLMSDFYHNKLATSAKTYVPDYALEMIMNKIRNYTI